MKLPWTKYFKPGSIVRTASRTAPVIETAPPPGPDPVSQGPLGALPLVPFSLDTCTLLERPSEAEQSAFNAHLRAHPTRAGFWEHAPAADWMLDVLRGSWHWIPVAPEAALRTFALQCVADLRGADAPRLVELTSTVHRRIAGSATTRELQAAQAEALPLVSPAGVMGLPRCSAQAAGQLAAWHTADASPYEAAFWAARFAALHDAFVALADAAASWNPPDGTPGVLPVRAYAQANPHVRAQACRDAHARQAIRLKTLLPQPFAGGAAPARPS